VQPATAGGHILGEKPLATILTKAGGMRRAVGSHVAPDPKRGTDCWLAVKKSTPGTKC
jgi:hypothetical protein